MVLRHINWFQRKALGLANGGWRPAGARAATTIAARLTFERVERRYGASHVLRGFSLDIAPAEVVCLLGPSGSGKTTLLRIAAGIEKPTGGRVLINDSEVAGPHRFVPPEKRNVGLMFQDFALFPHLSIRDNVAFGLKSLPREDAAREALSALARVGLERYAGHYPNTLSGGEQQRVALARAFVHEPEVLFADEPTGNLDQRTGAAVSDLLFALNREHGTTLVLVTHDIALAGRCERGLRLADGRIVDKNPAAAGRHEPALAREAGEGEPLAERAVGEGNP